MNRLSTHLATIVQFVLVAALLSVFIACSESKSGKNAAKWHRVIVFFDGERKLQLDYEGTGYRQSSLVADDSVVLEAMHLEHWSEKDFMNPKHVDASFEGKIISSGAVGENVDINLSITNTVPLEIRILGMELEGTKETGTEEVTFKYSAGQHSLKAKGKIAALFEKER
jgi:hypothetical protein